ncbi:SPFH domain-containing protein [Blastopirellula retiformator]|uniref:SPFH domain / Band 7 family protein n=1 Tax=Blastopirellula retiformator TaxID=2527970 RepID=A0A5C5UWC7_9BACT|nr:SPFH domain-containing protein [Blastopirellula retiformator]TWT30651.1 SPFH domain / Band 7 family protein [Blastopirellula retiformator]
MLGISYVKAPPSTHVMLFRRGKVVCEGAGQSFFYFSPTATLVQLPLASTDVPFVFNEVTADFQDATIQGELTFRVTSPAKLASLLDFSVDSNGRYRSDDPTKLNDRLIHTTQTLARAFTLKKTLRELLTSSDELVAQVFAQLAESPAVALLGVEVMNLSVLSIKAMPEMAKALQAEAREQLLLEADEAIYARRNTAVELERQIKENELNTEIAVQQKQRQVRETKLQADIAIEQERATLVDRKIENERKESEAKADALKAMLEPLKDIDWRTLLAAAPGGLNANQLIAMAFRDLADNAENIGNLNISPDLLSTLLDNQSDGGQGPGKKRKSR